MNLIPIVHSTKLALQCENCNTELIRANVKIINDYYLDKYAAVFTCPQCSANMTFLDTKNTLERMI